MKTKFKKSIKRLGLLVVIVIFSVWLGSLLKNYILTVMYKDELNNLTICEEDYVPDYEFIRITSYSEGKIEIYFVDVGVMEIGDRIEKTRRGGTARYLRGYDGKWSFSENITWSEYGTADHLIWPYWHHAFYLYFY